MNGWRARFQAESAAWGDSGLRRLRRVVRRASATEFEVDGRRVTAFASNDYLGFACHPRLAEALAEGARLHGAGSGASHLISGHLEVHEQLEHELARFAGKPAALTFISGYAANNALLTALAGEGDLIHSDELNHASIIDGARLSRASVEIYPHRDMDALEANLRSRKTGQQFVITDAVFSMDGDVAPLREMVELCERYDALLVVDDAHGIGVWGPQGRGSIQALCLQSELIVYMGTLGKAAGLSGAFVAAEDLIVDRLVQRARPYVFSTASSPALAHATIAALDLIRGADAERERLNEWRARLQSAAEGWAPYRLLPSDMPIQPLLVGGNREALRLAERLLDEGLWVPAIRPPTVPAGTARLRIALSAAHTAAQVGLLCESLGAALERGATMVAEGAA